ncbi:MAG: NAD-dependent epimerase/dehydratase family protein [Dongiaceae bacterium]
MVTGAAGFVGSHLVRRLLVAGCDVAAVMRPSTEPWRLADLTNSIETIRCELDELSQPETASRLHGAALVFHLAAAGTNQSDNQLTRVLKTNVDAMAHVVALARALKVERLVCAGTGFEYGPTARATETSESRPVSEYAASKAAGLMLTRTLCRIEEVPLTWLRTFSVYGPLQAHYFVVPHTIVKALRGETIDITGGEQTRDFVHIDDVVDAYLAAAEVPSAADDVFNICTGVPTTIRGLVEDIVAATGGGARPSFGERPYRSREVWSSWGDPSKAARVLGWRPRTAIHEGLRATIDWFRRHAATYNEYRP